MTLPNYYIPIEGESNLVRDIHSNAVLNVNVQAFENYKRGRNRQQMIDKSIEDVQNLKNDVAEMKGMLKAILENINK